MAMLQFCTLSTASQPAAHINSPGSEHNTVAGWLCPSPDHYLCLLIDLLAAGMEHDHHCNAVASHGLQGLAGTAHSHTGDMPTSLTESAL